MASEYSFDVVSHFDAQELRNAIDQVRREISTRYDFKGTNTEVELNDEDITVIAPDKMKLAAVLDMIYQKIINRKLSPKILDIQDSEAAAGGTVRQVYKLIKVLDQESCKQISKIVKEKSTKAKATIQGTAVRISSKDKDELQMIMSILRQDENIKIPLEFENYR